MFYGRFEVRVLRLDRRARLLEVGPLRLDAAPRLAQLLLAGLVHVRDVLQLHAGPLELGAGLDAALVLVPGENKMIDR